MSSYRLNKTLFYSYLDIIRSIKNVNSLNIFTKEFHQFGNPAFKSNNKYNKLFIQILKLHKYFLQWK